MVVLKWQAEEMQLATSNTSLERLDLANREKAKALAAL